MRLLLVPAVLTAALALNACGPGTAAPTATPKPTETVAAPGVTPTPTPEPVAEPVTCESLLSTSLSEYTSSGLHIEGPGSYADKLESEGNVFFGFYEAGGVFCIVVTGMEAYALYGWAPFDDASWEPIRASNLAEGWTEETTDAGFLMRSPEPQALSVCYYRPGEFGACAATDDVLDEIIGNAPSN